MSKHLVGLLSQTKFVVSIGTEANLNNLAG